MTDPKADKRGDEKMIDLSLGRIRYRETGEGRPVVFVHGYLVDGELWREAVPTISAAGFRCITPDLPLGAHVEPIGRDRQLTPRSVAGAVRELIEKLDLDDVVIVGNDSGGAICQMLVTESTDRIGHLVLSPCDTYRKFPPFPYNALRHVDKLGPLIGPVFRLSASRLGRWAGFAPLLGSAWDAELVRRWYEPARRDKRILIDGFRFVTSADPDELEAASNAMATVDLPTTIIWGRDTRFFTFEDGSRLAASMPHGELVPLEHGQTFLPFEKADEFARAVVERIDSRVRLAA